MRSCRWSATQAVLTHVHRLLVAQLVHEGSHTGHVAVVDDARVQLPLVQDLQQEPLRRFGVWCSAALLHYQRSIAYRTTWPWWLLPRCSWYMTSHLVQQRTGRAVVAQSRWQTQPHLVPELRQLPPELRHLLGCCRGSGLVGCQALATTFAACGRLAAGAALARSCRLLDRRPGLRAAVGGAVPVRDALAADPCRCLLCC